MLFNNLLTSQGLPAGLFRHNKLLKDVHFSNNRLRSWPAPLADVRESVVVLNMASNGLSAIPSYVNQFPKLKYLDVSGNNVSLSSSLLANLTTSGANAVPAAPAETLLLLGRNPLCAGKADGSKVAGLGIDEHWNPTCQFQCAPVCHMSVDWIAADNQLLDGICSFNCDVEQCNYDGGECS